MKIGDLAIENLKKYVEIKGLSEKGNKKELCERILKYAEQQVIKEIQQCFNDEIVSKEPQEDKMEINDELGKELQNFILSHHNEKTKILKSYDDLQTEKQKLKQRIEQQKQTVLNFPSILRFNAGREVSISKSFLEKHPNSLLYTLISSPTWFEKFQENENKYYLNCNESEMSKIVDFLRIDNISSPEVHEIWGFSSIKYSNTKCLDDKKLEQVEECKEDYQKFKELVENEIKYQSNLLTANFENYEKRLDALNQLVYNDPVLLNVGGQLFTISKTKLKQHENTYFAPLVSGQWELENNTHFIDRSYHHFHVIHDYLVSGKLSSNSHRYFNSLIEKDQNIFLQEVDYYQLNKLLDNLKYDFSQSQKLDEEELEYVQNLYPGKWRLLAPEEITETINKTTIIIQNTRNNPDVTAIGKFIKYTENFIDLTKKEPYVFKWLSIAKRGNNFRWKYDPKSLMNCLITEYPKIEIYVNIVS